MPLALAGCNEALSVVAPAGPAAAAIATLWWVMLAGAALICLLVAGLLWGAFRSRPVADGADGARGERVWIHGLGLAFPFAVLAALLFYGLWVGERLMPRAGSDVVSVSAVAQRWIWSFGYDDAEGRVTQGVLHIPAGRPVDVAITTRDVIHSFWVPRLAGKLDAIPGHVNVLRLEADRPGVYAGLSAEYSGAGYAGHHFEVHAHDAAGWSAFLRGERP
ncbi:cytochrome B [uncultured Jannaschia sp.]|uniref:cytochrome c oxidase subunit II n=1 Tax=uncultured Jannaschia sp. TaxID=293347 RepID=UPI002630AD46|nr:cytochrome B [uncultured Jannaschia sp.]